MQHKYSNDRTINMINYLCNCWSCMKEHSFLGFILNKSDYDIGLHLKDQDFNYIGCHVFYYDESYDDGASPAKDKDLCKSRPYIFMSGGTDDASYFKRFKTKDDAISYFHELKYVTNDIIRQCCYRN